MDGAGTLEKLEQRIAALENRICEHGDSNGNQGTVIHNLHGVKQKIAGLASGKSKTQAAWKRLEELNMLLDPELSSQLTLSNDAKTVIILAEQQQLKAQTALLEKVKELSSILDSEHIKGVAGLSDRLVPLTTVQVKQEEQAEELGEETNKLLKSYNDMSCERSTSCNSSRIIFKFGMKVRYGKAKMPIVFGVGGVIGAMVTTFFVEIAEIIITLLSKQFVQWDEVMTRYEVANQVRKPDIY